MKHIQLICNNQNIELVTKLRILGLIFAANYKWNEHLKYLKKSLAARVNFISFLSSNKCYVHINTLIYLVKTLVLSKIDFGLFLYGSCPKTTRRTIESRYHQAIRSCLYAYSTTNIINMRAEASLPSIEERSKFITAQLIPKLLSSTNSIINEYINTTIECIKVHNYTGKKRIPSAITQALEIATHLEIHLEHIQHIIQNPPWKIKPQHCHIGLSKHTKSITSDVEFRQMFLKEKEKLLSNGWNLIYTDGSKLMSSSTAYAVVNENGETLTIARLIEYTSIFTAEACAILKALETANNKTAICSDSLSVLEAVLSPNRSKWNLINKIKSTLVKNKDKFKLFWIPGHCGIIGNDTADEAAKFANSAPIITDPTWEKVDMKSYIKHSLINERNTKWSNYCHHHYKHINSCLTPTIYPTECDKPKIKVYSRLRLGHTIATHQHLRRGEPPPICSHCNTNLTVMHILSDCPALDQLRRSIFNDINPYYILKETIVDNIEKMYYFLKQSKFII